MTNGFTLAPSPVDRALLHFALAGTSLVVLDDTGVIRQRTELPHRDVNAIVFSPASPHVLYLGLKLSDMSVEGASRFAGCHSLGGSRQYW